MWGGDVGSADRDSVSDRGQEEGERQFNRNAPKCEQRKAASHQVYHKGVEDQILKQDPRRDPHWTESKQRDER